MVSQKPADDGAKKIGSYSQENTKTLLQYLYTPLDKQVINLRAEVPSYESHFSEVLSPDLLPLFREFSAPFNKFLPTNFDEKTSLRAALSGLFVANEKNAVRLFTELLTKTNRSFVVSYTLALLDAVINSNKRTVLLFRKNTTKSQPTLLDNLIKVFIKNKEDETIALLAARTVSSVINTQYFKVTPLQAEKYFNFFAERDLLNLSNEYFRDVISCFQKVLVADYLRDVFVYRTRMHLVLTNLLRHITLNDRNGANFAGLIQAGLQYQIVFCLWLVSFNRNIANTLTDNAGEKLTSIVSDTSVVGGVDFVTLLCDVVSLSERDKVHRICLATLVNLIKFTNPFRRRLVLITMVGLRFQDFLRQLERHQMSEEDSVNDDYRADFYVVLNFLNNGIDDLTNFEEYSAEVKSRRLTWSPAHKSERFWHENHMKLCDNDYEILKILISLLGEGVDKETVAIACHDIGEFCRHYNRGKYAVEKMGGKMAIMGLLNHEDLAVRYEALIAMQKFLLQNWEFLGKQLHNTDTFRVLPNSESKAEI